MIKKEIYQFDIFEMRNSEWSQTMHTRRLVKRAKPVLQLQYGGREPQGGKRVMINNDWLQGLDKDYVRM